MVLSLRVSLVPSIVRFGILRPWSTSLLRISMPVGPISSVTTYDKQFLLKAVLDGDINPGRVFTHSYSLDEIDQAYKDMDERKTIKAMIVID